MSKTPPKKKLLEWLLEFKRQAELDRVNIHNKLGEPERQPKESIWEYERRLKNAQVIRGYGKDDFILI